VKSVLPKNQFHVKKPAARDWLKQSAAEHRLPDGSTGIAPLRACAQWALNYKANGNDRGVPLICHISISTFDA
jgi:hypothetical protein